MGVFFSGCRNVSITQVDPNRNTVGAPAIRFSINGAVLGDGTYDGAPLGFTVHADGPEWSVTVEYLDVRGGGTWVASPVRVTNTPLGTEIRAIGPGDGADVLDDLVLFCAACAHRPVEAPNATWVTWGVTVDAGGLTGHGPVPPWTPFVREFAAGLALAEAAQLIRGDLRSVVLDAAAKQVSGAATALAKAITKT